ncbi:hypothetical protein ACLB1G_19190 [Oxalobacteraceae bacterium A2-2]
MPVHLSSSAMRLIAVLGLLACLAGCASSTPHMRQVREFAAQSSKLGAYTDLTERYRDTYQRAAPYLSPEADAEERRQDLQRRAAAPDFLAVEQAVHTYMRALGALAGDSQFDLEDQVKSLSGAIKAWPDSGLSDRHVNAYAGLARLLARWLTRSWQARSVQALLAEGAEPLQQLLDAMQVLLRYYDKNSDNESRMVLGMLEVSLAYTEPQQRLLAALGKARLQEKTAEYRLAGLRLTLARKHLAAIAQAHQALLAGLATQPVPAAVPPQALAATTP